MDLDDTPEGREESARRVLHGYRERRRRRRGEDTYFGSTECLLEHAEATLEVHERERRRSEIMSDAEAANLSR